MDKNISAGFEPVDMHELWREYVKFMKGERDNPFDHCGCWTPVTGFTYPAKD